MSKTRGAKKKRRDDDDMEVDEDDERVLFFIPSADINIEVLVFYLKKFLGHDSDAEPGRSPRVRLSIARWKPADHLQNRDVDGYFIRSRLGLSTVGCFHPMLPTFYSNRP